MAGLRDLDLRPGYDSEDDSLTQFLIPALQRSVSYARSVGYFRSSALAVAARGLSHFIAGGGRMRLIAGTDLTEEDCGAITGAVAVPEVLAERLADSLVPANEIERHRLEVLAWLAQTNRLLVKVAIPLDADGHPVPGGQDSPYFHEKIGVLRDADGEGVAFQGSVNETAHGWRHNFESFSVYTSWAGDPSHYDFWVERFEDRWANRIRGWRVVDLPRALHDRLLDYVPTAAPPLRDPEEPPDLGEPSTVARFLLVAPRLVGGDRLAEATSAVTLFPHQRQVVERLADEYPRSWLVADEVGLGKTISAGLALRRLVLSGDVRSALILAPASVCRQWQDELFEKFGLWIDRLDGGVIHAVHPDDDEALRPGVNPYTARDILIASSHLARRTEHQQQVLDAGPWDLLIVDEAHHARRQGTADPHRYRPGRLLELLDSIRDEGLARATWLLTATPMQVDPIELHDLLVHVELGGALASWERFQRWHEELANEDDAGVDWHWLAATLADSPLPPLGATEVALLDDIRRQAGPVVCDQVSRFGLPGSDGAQIAVDLGPTGRVHLRRWLRQIGPVGRAVTRHSRTTLKQYRDAGLLHEPVADRNVVPVLIEFSHDEALLYKQLDELIDRLLDVAGTRKGAGFFLTVYRRRLTSSWAAIRRTLEKRAARENSVLVSDDLDEEAERSDTTIGDELAALPLGAEDLAEIRRFISEIDLVNDSKFDRLRRDLDEARGSGQAVIVFTQFTDTLISLRDRLKGVYGRQLATFTGDGGRIFAGGEDEWEHLTKQELVDALRSRRVTVLLANDAASEGLNLQSCSWLINYDMPWNPMRAEQRIGRIDRIGQVAPVVEVRNYFIPGTVEERVYELLAQRIDSFSDLLGNLQPILGYVENAVKAVFEAPRSEREARSDAALEDIERRIDELESTGIDLTLEDPMPIPVQSPPPVTLEQLETLVQDHLGIQVGLPDRPATYDPSRTSRDTEGWRALATFGHPRLEAALRGLADDAPPASALVISEHTEGEITRAAASRADRSPPEPVQQIDELSDLSEPAAADEAGVVADQRARDAALRRLEHLREVVARRAVLRESRIRQEFVRLVRRTIVAECSLAYHDGQPVPDPVDVWGSLAAETSTWRYAESFRRQLGMDVDELLPDHPADLTSDSPGQARANHRLRTADELRELMVDWREFQAGLT